MRLTRRQFGAAALAATAASTVFNKHVFAQAGKISMKMGGNMSTDHPALLERVSRDDLISWIQAE